MWPEVSEKLPEGSTVLKSFIPPLLSRCTSNWFVMAQYACDLLLPAPIGLGSAKAELQWRLENDRVTQLAFLTFYGLFGGHNHPYRKFKWGFSGCFTSKLKPNKGNSTIWPWMSLGYCQGTMQDCQGASHNKIAVLSRIACFYAHGQPPVGTECSHLCGNSVCFNPLHVAWETKQLNESRRGCRKWVVCGVCNSCVVTNTVHLVWVCDHNPRCIKANQAGLPFHLYSL